MKLAYQDTPVVLILCTIHLHRYIGEQRVPTARSEIYALRSQELDVLRIFRFSLKSLVNGTLASSQDVDLSQRAAFYWLWDVVAQQVVNVAQMVDDPVGSMPIPTTD